ncbi:hypothetical protein LTS18_002700 [Coniosporium uncinatum]|uniref:Uncharacterized protein n=1 Tax=Coniosporium uncinatum TaxID=93489 RepID=A0ACC3DCP6_9PEZI|nr:hypothetical protein LTS18_002700 [Coniosporium uncinatum]
MPGFQNSRQPASSNTTTGAPQAPLPQGPPRLPAPPMHTRPIYYAPLVPPSRASAQQYTAGYAPDQVASAFLDYILEPAHNSDLNEVSQITLANAYSEWLQGLPQLDRPSLLTLARNRFPGCSLQAYDTASSRIFVLKGVKPRNGVSAHQCVKGLAANLSSGSPLLSSAVLKQDMRRVRPLQTAMYQSDKHQIEAWEQYCAALKVTQPAWSDPTLIGCTVAKAQSTSLTPILDLVDRPNVHRRRRSLADRRLHPGIVRECFIDEWREKLPLLRSGWVVKSQHIDLNGTKINYQLFNKLYLELKNERAQQVAAEKKEREESALAQALLREIHAMDSARIQRKPEPKLAIANSATKPDGFFKYWATKVDAPKPAQTVPPAQPTAARTAMGPGRPARPIDLTVDPVASPITVPAAASPRKRKADTPIEAPTPTNEDNNEEEDESDDSEEPAAKKRRRRKGGRKGESRAYNRFAPNWFIKGWGYNAPYDFGAKSEVAAQKTLEEKARGMGHEQADVVDRAYTRMPGERVPTSEEIEEGATVEEKDAVSMFAWRAERGTLKDYMRSIGADV